MTVADATAVELLSTAQQHLEAAMAAEPVAEHMRALECVTCAIEALRVVALRRELESALTQA